MHDAIANLPPGSALARAQGRVDPMQLFHEWMHTLLKFQAGKRVTTPAMVKQERQEAQPQVRKRKLIESLRTALTGD